MNKFKHEELGQLLERDGFPKKVLMILKSRQLDVLLKLIHIIRTILGWHGSRSEAG